MTLEEVLLKSFRNLGLEQGFHFQHSKGPKHNEDDAGVASLGMSWIFQAKPGLKS